MPHSHEYARSYYYRIYLLFIYLNPLFSFETTPLIHRLVYITNRNQPAEVPMKNLIKRLTVFIILTLFIASCSGRGPVGPEGPQGEPGPEILPTSFEFNATLLPSNGYEFYHSIPGQIDIIDSDVVLAFILEDYIEEDDLEVWRKLPITEFNSRGTLLIDYDFTLIDVRIFLNSNYNLNITDGLEDVLIRAVHIPSNFVAKIRGDQSLEQIETYQELQAFLGNNIVKIN